MDKKLLENLKIFGLTDYEAKAYTALVSLGTPTVTEISQLCDVPRSNLYAVLEKLNEKGFVEIQKGRPILFKARDPERVLDEAGKEFANKVKDAKKEALQELRKISSKGKTDVEPALIWGVKGPEAVMNKTAEIIKRSKSEIFFNIPDVSVLDDNILEQLNKAKERGVKIKIVTERKKDLKKFQKYGVVRTRDKIYGIDILSDGKEILIGPSLPLVAVWLNNPEMALHVKDFLDLLWKDADIMK